MEKSNSLRRTIAFFLAILLGLQVVGENTSISYAENNEAATVTMYGDNGSGAVDLATDKNAQFEYGMPITLSLSGVNVDAKDKVEYYIKTGNAEDEPYNSTTIYEPGLYKLGYYIIDENDEIIKQDTTFTNYAFTIVAELGVPSGLRWDGTKAVWDTLKTDKNGKNLKEGTVCNYTVTLYKNGEKVTGQEKEVTGTNAESQSFDFGEVIASAGGGKGKYTFSVKATVPDFLTDYYKASADSQTNTSELYAVEVTLDKKAGISSAAVKDDTDTAFLLIAGDARYNSKEISATAASGWNFGSWSVDGESDIVSGFSFDSASNANAKITIADAYSGSTEVKVIANPQESNAPTISEYKVGTGENKGKLVATALDDQSGLKAYAFSTADAAGKVGESEWKVLDNATVEAQTVTFTPAASGTYYFYAKDADGNISGTSGMEAEGIEKAIPVTVISYADYYENNEKVSTKKDVYIGSESYTLPALTDSDEAVHRKGYVFDGWYTTEDLTGEAVSSLTGNSATDVTYYAKWTLTELTWATGLEDLEKREFTYTGKDIPLTVKVNDTTADVTYTWYKKDSETEEFKKIESVTTETLNIRNVSDSGEYRVDAKITYTDDAGVVQEKTLTGTPVTFTINKASLKVTANRIHVTYGDEAPAQSQYTVTYDELLGEDQTKALITEGSLSCAYEQGNPCKYDEEGNLTGYTIIMDKDTFSSKNAAIIANYNITTQNGTLIVDPKNVEAADTTVTVTLDDTKTYTYNGSPVIPTITIQDGEDAIDPSNYTITYDDNTSAGTHMATVTFKGNYTGVVTKNFIISQKGDYDPTVMIEGWDYGESAKSPYISNTIPYENPEITYYYLTGEVSDLSEAEGSTVQPVNAGTYTVYATVKDPEGNYAEKRTAPYTFGISPRTIILIAGSETWEYDGNSHSYDSYTIKDKGGNTLTEDQVFVLQKESFQSIKVTGSVTDVNLDENGVNIGQKNTVSYTLTSVTNEDNYNIQCVDGTLKVTPTKLPSPANLQWDNANPGTATWVAVSRSGLVVNYKVELYMHDGASAEGEDQLIATKETQNSETSVNFADDIHGQISTGAEKSFYFKVQAIASGSIEEGKKVQDDYMDSEMSEPSASIYTATIYLTKKLCDAEAASDQEGLESIGFTGSYEGREAVTLIAGESFTAKAVAKAGYEFTYRATCNHDVTYTPVWHPTKPEYSQYFTSSYDAFGSSVTVTVKSNLTASLTDVYMTASVADSSPFYRNFKAENKADNSAVTFSIELMDELGIKRWRLEKVEEKTITYEDGSTYTDYDTIKVYDWKSFKKDDGTYPANVYVPASIDIQEPGTYRIQYSDEESGESRVYPTNEAFTVYEIQFDKGATDDEIHTMNPIYKLANTEITLPACAFTKTGYSFQNWSGAATGISVDQAVFKANANDTLVANWTNDQYTYTVEYYYMNADGSYSAEPSETETFTGKYGDVIVASTDGTDTATESIQKPKNNYSNDANPDGVSDYNNTITLTGPDQVLRIYYKTGSYTITYRYTVPGDASPTEKTLSYNYGAAITELAKPSKDGYDFVGWVYEGYGSAPETMPAKNLTATGTFAAKSAKYQVVYHLETLGSGENHTEVYEVDDSRTQSFNSKQDEIIKAYLTKGSDLDTNEMEGTVIDGFTLKGVVVSYGAASNAGEGTAYSLPDGTITAEGEYAEGKVTCDTANTLYINYYYTRNVYNLTLEVWKESRESESNRLYKKTQVCQYGEDISALAAQYQENSYYIKEDGTSNLDDFAMPAGYKFASYTDFSTGMAPTTMPAGDVTVTRDVIAADKVKYKVQVYFEKSAIGSYDQMTELTFEAIEDTKIKIVGTEDPQNDSSYTYVDYNDFVKTLNNYNYYTHVVLAGSMEEGTVRADESNPLVLKVYFERITTTATIKYYYGNSKTNGNKEFASFTVEGKWGDKYEFDPIALFDENTSEDWLSQNRAYQNDKVTTTSVTVNNITDSNGTEYSGLTYDFRNNNYLVSYQCRYKYFNTSDVVTQTWPAHTFTTVSAFPQNYDTGYGAASVEPKEAGLNDTITCYFGTTVDNHDAYCHIFYNQIVEDEDFYLDVRLDYQSNFKDNTLAWYHGTAENGGNTDTVCYGDSTKTYIPITYPYDADKNGTIGANEYYQLRIMNKCAIVNGTPIEAGGGVADYPAANAKTRKYSYPETITSDILKPGFTHITGEYYYYNPDKADEATKEALKNTPCVFLADPDDRFMQGAYVQFVQGSGTDAYKQASAFLDAYKEAHKETASPATPDDSATALVFNNTSYGSTYVYGTHNYLTYSFYYRDKCQLQFYYNGKTCDNKAAHEYVYGTSVPRDQVTCSHVATVPAGYEIVWYTDSSFTNPIPETGLVMNVSRTVYGRMEKTTIPNMEYIYYELPDPIVVNETTYRYVTQDNLDILQEAGKTITHDEPQIVNIDIDNGHGGTISKPCEITTYKYDGAIVMVSIERPTVSFTELKLAKDTEVYTDYYGKDYKTAYGMDGFYYDETNTDNRSYGYVNTTPLNLKVYFARDKYQVEVITNVSEDSNPEYYTFSIDQKVQLDMPVKNGYEFAGWSWKKQMPDSTWEEYTPTMIDEEGVKYFKMPGVNLQATANWTAAEFDQTVTHYFQTASQVYDSTFISGITGTPSKTMVGVTFWTGDISITGSAAVYKKNDMVTAVVLTTGDGDKYYFSGGKLESESITLQESDLVAAVTKIQVTSEAADTKADQGALTGWSMYNYSYTSYHSGKTVQSLGADSTYTPVYGMTLEYYYTRSAKRTVRLLGVSTDGGESGLTCNGAGEHIYGESVNLVAALSDGYSFLGWYNAGDVLEGYPDAESPEKPLSEYPLRSDLETALSGVTAVSSDSTYRLSITENLDLVAVVKPETIIPPDLEINGKTSYTYGYEASASNALTAIASKHVYTADEVADEAEREALNAIAAKTTVTGYQWYEITKTKDENENEVEVVTEMPGQTSSTLLISTGKKAGAYQYRCVVSYKNSDNGRTGTILKDQEIVVNKANMTVNAIGYTGVFDNQPHSITLSVSKPVSKEEYTIYYSSETELNEENYTAGTTELPEYVDVNNNGSSACAHTTYFYILDQSGNYNSYAGSKEVNITPKEISIKALNATFSKMYDGNKEVVGEPTDEGSDMYNFANYGKNRYYALSGFVDEDTAAGTYILDCDAEFNDSHVTTARSFTISNLKLVYPSDGNTAYNYSFPSTTKLTFAGMITPRTLEIEWEDEESFVYNGQPQAPTVKLSDTQTYPIPDADKDYIELTVTGKQTNVGNYTAYASAGRKMGAQFNSSDYTFDDLSKDYNIVARNITIKPVYEEVTYDGNPHTNSTYQIYYGDQVDSVVSAYTTTATPVKSYTNAGTYGDMVFTNLVISDSSGKILTDNYAINYGTGTLKIKPAPVKVTGIIADEKNFDGTTSVTIHTKNASGNSILTFEPLYSQGTVQDELNLDINKITAAYASSAAGTTTVNLTIPVDALTGRSTDNYVLDIENSQKTATGKIKKSVIKLKADAVETVYGESASFTYTNSEIRKEDGTEGIWSDIVSGEVKYLINAGTKENPDWTTYSAGNTSVGPTSGRTYEIQVDIRDLRAKNYEFAWEEDPEAVLTVKKRPVSLNEIMGEGAILSKTYDGTITAAIPQKGINYSFGTITDAEENVIPASGVLAADEETFDLGTEGISYKYDTKDVSTASKVILTATGVNNANYELVNTSCEIPGKITPADLTIKAKDTTIYYGDKNPAYCVEYEGFVEVNGVKETAETALTGTLTFSTSAYDATVAIKRHVGTYENDITPSGLSAVNGNYRITYKPATLTVNPVTVYLTAQNKELRYKVGNDEDGDGNTGELPSYTFTGPDWKYSEDAGRYNLTGVTLPRTVTGLAGDDEITLLTIPDDYPIKISVDTNGNVTGIEKTDPADTYEDYIFKAVDGTLTVKKYLLKITGTLSLADKVYDGTDKIVDKPTDEAIKALFYEGVAPEDDQYIGIDTNALLEGSHYASKDVGESISVTLNIVLNEELDKRYELDTANTNVTAISKILPRPIEVKAKDKTITYGNDVPTDYGIEAVQVTDPVSDTNMGLVSGEALTAAYTFTGPTGYTCDYTDTSGNYSSVGTYSVTPNGVSATNYAVTCKNTGVLTVKQATLATPVPTWDETAPGTVKWEAVSGIGDVSVAGYKVELYKNGSSTAVKTIEQTTALSVDLANDIRDVENGGGGGQYTVKVTAIASIDNNEDKKNVADSATGTTVKALYATKITPVFAETLDEGTLSGIGDQVDSRDPIYVNDKSSYVAIAGESDIPIKGILQNETGYTVEATADSGLTLGSIEDGGISKSGSEVSYNTIVSVATDAKPVAETKVTLTLTAREATLNAAFTVDKTSETYGFLESSAPKFTATATPAEGDNITAEKYTYSYKWVLQPNGSTGYNDVQTGEGSTYVFPYMYDGNNYTPVGSNYRVKCYITATRKDNGVSVIAKEAISASDPNKKYIQINIKRASYNPAIAFDLGKETWVYGTSRNLPVVSNTAGEVTKNDIHLLYSKDGATWQDEMYTNVGTYKVMAHIYQTTNYDAVDTNVIEYTITQAKLDKPDNVDMTASDTAPYGKITWDAVTGPKENAGASDSDSEIQVKYELTLEYMPKGGDTKQQIGDAVTTSSTSYDFTDRITKAGTYYVTVRAIVDEQNKGQDALNCADSDPVTKEAFITIGAQVSATGDGVTANEKGFSKVYDGNPLTLMVEYSDGGTPSYQWMKDGQAISGATGSSISITYVEESTNFVCEITTGSSDKIYTSVVKASITPRPITITTNTDGKTYDGSALTDPDYTITSDLGLATGDTITSKTMSASQTNAGSTDNTISDIVITRNAGNAGEKVVYSDTDSSVKDNYTITIVKGTLTVSERPITIKAKDASKTYDGKPLTLIGENGYYSNPADAYAITSGSLVTGESIDASTLSYSGTITDVSEEAVINTPSGTGAIIKKGDSDVTANYAITYESGMLTIVPKPLEITADSAAKIYDGSALTKNSYQITGGTSLVSGDGIASVQITGTQTGFGVSDNVPTAAVIKRGDADISGNYAISYKNGTLKVEQRAITITAEDKESCYGEMPRTLTYTITNPADAGEMEKVDIGRELSITLSCDVTSTTPVGDAYPITVSYDTTNPNYTVTPVAGTYKVTPAAITLTAQDSSVVYDKEAHSLTFTVTSPATDGVTKYYSTSNLTDGQWQTEIGNLTSGGTSDTVLTTVPSYTNAGNYTVYCYGVKENYTAGKASATLTIAPKSISNSDITVDALSSVTYNGSAYTPAVTVRYGETLLIDGTDYDVAYANNTNAGNAKVTITGKGNYKDSRPVQFTINPLPVVLTWTDPADLTYNGQAKTVTATITNQCGTDEVTVSTYINHVKTDAGSYTASAYALDGAAASNYTLTGAENVSHAYTITKRTLKIKTADDTKVYDGTALTKQGYSLLDGTTLAADGETLAITYSGTQTNAGSSGNTVSSIAIKRGEGENEVDVTANYAITTTPGQLTVTPKPLVSGDLTMTTSDSEPYEWEYTGSEIVPTYVVKKELILGAGTVTLTENTDYTVTSDSAKTATDVGTYTITVEGTGNYSGTISVSYSIVDNTKAQITGITDRGNYCISADIEVTDPNLSEVVIKKGGTEVASFTTFTNGRLTYTIDGSGADEAGSTYTVYVKDLSAKDATGVATYHEQTYTITLYPDHKYNADQSEYTWDTGKLMGTQECKNTGDATDTIINRWGTVVWNYAYSYSTSEGVQSGTQGVEARATYAKVELLQNGNVIATQYVDCDSTCGVGGSNQDSGMDTFKFTTYDPADPTAAAGTANIPQKDENGNEYDYSLKFTIGKMSDSVFTAVNDYAYSDSADYTNPYTSSGYQRTYSYSPGCFDVPWKVVLRNLPKDEDGNLIYPSELYVKVLYAMSEDADDSETAVGYQIISQQAGASDLGVPCTASVSGDTVVYTGSYPVWKYIGGTTDSYYHRIQVVGYKLNNEYVDVSADKLKSINDSDHVNHTIYHVNETDQASGTILYELSALLPSLVFERNDGSTQAHAVINSVANGTVSYDDIQRVSNPIRSGYTFQGWYTQPTDGNKVTSDVNVGTLGVTLYAHWAKNAVPPQTPEENPGTDQPPVNPQNPGNQETPEIPETEPTDDGTDPNQNTGSGQAPRGENPGENTPSQPGDTSAAGGSEKDLAEKDNSLVVYTEHANGDNGKEAASGEAGQSAGSGNVQDNSSYLTATLPDTGAVANTVLSEEEWKLLEEGGDIAIRLTIDDTRRQEDDERVRNFMEELLEQALSESDTKDKTVQFKSYVDLRLEKRINDADWERLYRTKEPIEIVIHIPEDMIREGETLYLAKADGSGYIMLEDLDADPNTITIMTAEFDSEYVLVSIADEETPLMLLEQDCRWHYLILIVTLLYFLVLLLTLKRKEDEEETSCKKCKRNSVITRSVAQIILLLIYLYVNIRGFCEIELPASVVGTLLILIEQMLTFRHKFKQESKRETE